MVITDYKERVLWFMDLENTGLKSINMLSLLITYNDQCNSPKNGGKAEFSKLLFLATTCFSKELSWTSVWKMLVYWHLYTANNR